MISILAMIGGLLAFQAKDLLHTYGFRQDISLLKGRLELAQHYARSYQADVEVIFNSKQGTTWCELRSDEPYLHAHKMFYSPCVLKKIKAIYFAGTEEAASTLLFSGTGWMFPVTNLDVYATSDNKEKATIFVGEAFQ